MESASEVVTKTAPEKSVSVEDGKQVEAEQEVEATVTLKNGEEVVEDDTKNGNETVQVEETVIKQETSSAEPDEEIVEEEVEEEEIEEEEEEEDDSVEQKVIEKVVDTTDGSETNTVTTVTTVKEQSKPNGTTTTKTVTTTKVSKEAPQTKATTVITTTPPTPTTEEIKTLNTETKSELPTNAEVEEESVEEEVEEDDEEDEQEEVSTVSEQQQQLQKDQIPQEVTPKQAPAKEEGEDATDASSAPSKTNEPQSHIPTKQDNLNNTLKDIISSIDSNIIAEENIAALKQRELELLKKQQELAMEIKQQQLLAQKLANENQFHQQQQQQYQQQQHHSNTLPETIFSQKTQPINNVSKYSTYEEKQDENNYSRKTETYETRESTNVSKKVDLHKIFTPATDAEEILPKNHYHQYQQQPKPPTSPSILPAYSDAAKHRVQMNMHQEQLLEKYAKPGLKVVKTPWEAALESGSASAAFVEEQKLSPYPTPARSPAPQYFDASHGGVSYEPASGPTVTDSYNKPYSTDSYPEYTPQPQHQHKLPQAQYERRQPAATNPQRELAYKPSLPQGWKAPSMSLPKDLYVPKEIPLQSYAPPPNAAIPPSASPSMKNSYDNYEPSWKSSNQSQHTYQPPAAAPFSSSPAPAQTTAMPYGGTSSFPLTKPSQMGFSTTYGSNQPPKQQFLPAQSYQTVPQATTQNIPQVNFNPSPLPYDKLAKFENPSVDSYNNNNVYSPPRSSHLNVQGSKIRNTSPAPFGGSYQQRPYTPSMESSSFVGTPSISPRPPSSLQQQCSGNITPIPQSSYNSNQLLNAPTYNSSARGWRSSGPSAGYQTLQQQRPMAAPMQHIVSAGNMPYTDF